MIIIKKEQSITMKKAGVESDQSVFSRMKHKSFRRQPFALQCLIRDYRRPADRRLSIVLQSAGGQVYDTRDERMLCALAGIHSRLVRVEMELMTAGMRPRVNPPLRWGQSLYINCIDHYKV